MASRIKVNLPTSLIEQWHPTKNLLAASEVTATSHKKAWWQCGSGHEWEAEIRARVRGNGCPYCSGRLVTVGTNDLATVSPLLACQWHPTKNGDLTPQSVTRHSSKSVWWFAAECGHEWQGVITHRSDSPVCNVCSGKAFQPGINDLATKRPHVAAWLNSQKNTLLPSEIFDMSTKMFWWKCEKGHEWKTTAQRVTECPECRVLVPVELQLFSVHPELQAFWHPTKNSDRSFESLSAHSSFKAWWECQEGHEWLRQVNEQVGSTGCPYCQGYRLLSGFNDLSTAYPEIAMQWHPTKNGTLTPENTLSFSIEPIWWQCEKGHEWQTSLNLRTQRGYGCPTCSGQKVVAGFNDLTSQRPELAEQWHPTKNGTLTANAVTVGSGKVVWWQCSNAHEWKSSISFRASGGGCPYCANTRLWSGFNDLETQFPDLAAQWHPTKNASITARDIVRGSTKKVWWTCDQGHEYDMRVIDRTIIGMQCPLCSGRRVVAGVNDLATLHPLLAQQWHLTKNAPLRPSMVTEQSNRKVWWKCEQHGHEWQAKVQSRTLGDGCPICSNFRILVGFNDLATLDTELTDQWHPTKNTPLMPSMVSTGSHKKVWWKCKKDHVWNAVISDRSRGIGCQQCSSNEYSSKGEKAVAAWVTSLGFTPMLNARSVLKRKELDIYIPEKKIAIEFNGVYWHSERNPKMTRTYHYDKWKACQDQGIQLIQVWEDDWNRSPEIVKNMLAHKLGVTSSGKIHARKTVVRPVTTTEAKEFLAANHIQGFASGGHYLGLALKGTSNQTETPEMFALLVLRRERNGDHNIVRYATSTQVVGGFTKLLAYAERNFEVTRFTTFSDNTVSDGGLYESNGFVAEKSLPPDYTYFVRGERKHKFGYRLKRFKNDPALIWEEGLTERELAALNNLPRIWDAGKTKWVREVA